MATAQHDALLWHIRKLAAGRSGPQRTDRQLLEDFSVCRDQAAFAALIVRHGPLVLRVCRRVLHHEQDAEDAFQATFLVLAQKAGSIRKREALAEWLHGVAYRTAMAAKRKAARRRNHEARLGALLPQATPSPSWDDVRAVLDEEVERLPTTFRTVFVLCVLEGKSGPEAAAELGLPPGTVSSRLTRARQRLQQRLARRGIELSALLAALAVADSASQAGVPAVLASATLRLGLLAAAGGSAAGGIPAHVAALAAGVTRAMLFAKVKIATTIVLTVSLLAGGTGMVVRQALAGKAVAQQPPATKTPAPNPLHSAAKSLTAEKNGQSITINGRVLDPEGNPVAGARLYQAYHVPFIEGNPPPAPRLRGRSGPNGRFHLTFSQSDLEPIAKRVLQIVAVAETFGPGWQGLEKPYPRELTLRLARDDVPIAGRVLDLQGRPIAGVTITPIGLMTTSAEDLTPWFQAIQDKKRFQHRDILTKQLLAFPEAIPGLPRTVTTDADGRFRLTGVGRERVLAVMIGGPKVSLEPVFLVTRAVPKFPVHDNPSTDHQFMVYGASFEHVAAPAKPIAGTVRDKDTGKPLAGVRIQFDPWGPGPTARSGQDGKYRLDSLPGDFAGNGGFGLPMLAIPPQDQPYLVGFQEVKRGPGIEATAVNFQLKRGLWAQGRVTDKITGQPVQAALEYQPAPDNAFRMDGPNFTRFPSIAKTLYRTRPDGTFRIPVLPGPGVIVGSGPYVRYVAAGTARINPPKDAEAVSCQIVLDPGRTVTGKILDPDGKPLPGVRVFNMDPLHSWTRRPLEKADFTLTAVDPRARRSLIFLHQERRLVKALEMEGNTPSPLTVRLEPAGTVMGHLVDEDGQPRPKVELLIQFIRKDNDYVAEHLPARIVTDRKGGFRAEGLAPGVVYQINLAGKAPNQTIGSVVPRLSVQSGETMDLGDVKERSLQE